MYYQGFENPKLAAIRLLRSQGCCESMHEKKLSSDSRISPSDLQKLLRYKQQLEQKVAVQRAKLADTPCILQLGKQIEELQQIIEGLSRENRQMIKYMNVINKQTSMTFSTECDEQEEERQHQKLQAQYRMLLKRLEKVNEKNSSLVNKLVNF